MDTYGLPRDPDGSFLASRGGRYSPISVLGRGSMGTCVLVRLTPEAGAGSGPRGLRVVKTVDLLRATDEDTASKRSEALREAEVLKSLRHPNIIGYDDAFFSDQHLCIVMEYADGGDLAGAIAGRRDAARRYHEREAMAIFAQLALALRHVHDLRILHRDVKSQNVFLTNTGVVKLGDFGVAKVLTDSEVCAATRIGTPQCVPPELCENATYDFKVDIWGLGVIFYQLLALECPFNGGSIAALAVRICTAEPRPVPSVYSSEARTLVSRLLSKRADDRPSSIAILAMPYVRRSASALPGRQPLHEPQSARESVRRRSADAPSAGGQLEAGEAEASEPRAVTSPAHIVSRWRPSFRERHRPQALRRCATVSECTSPEHVNRPRRGRTSPQKKCGSPYKHRGSPKKGRDGCCSPKKRQARHSLAALLSMDDLADAAFASPVHGNLTDIAFASPGSKDVSDLIASILESPVTLKTARSEGADTTTSTRAATYDALPSSRSLNAGGSDPGGERESTRWAAEDLATCTALLSELEIEFGLSVDPLL